MYIAQSPLYKVQKGKEVTYLYSEEEKIKMLGDDADDSIDNPEDPGDSEEEEEEEESEKSKRTAKVKVQRYKGLGEMNADELKETTMSAENRVLKQVSIEDAEEADKVFDLSLIHI